MMKPIGFRISAHFNDTEMFDRDDLALARCPICHSRLDFEPYNPDYAFTKTFRPLYMTNEKISLKTAVTVTYDGQKIVTKPFKEFCELQGYEGLIFRGFPKDPWYFQLIVTRQVTVDKEKSKVRFGRFCPKCKNYFDVNLTYDPVLKFAPVFLDCQEPLTDGFYRSDLFFASGNEKHPLIIVGNETHDKLKAAKFKGLVFHPVYSNVS